MKVCARCADLSLHNSMSFLLAFTGLTFWWQGPMSFMLFSQGYCMETVQEAWLGIHPSVSSDTCFYFAVASKIIGMGLEYLTRLWRPTLANTPILNESKVKPLTHAEHRLLQARKFLDAFRAVISKQEETSQCPDLIKPRGTISFASEINPLEAMGSASLTQGYWEQTPKHWLKAHPNTYIPHMGCPVILGSYLTFLWLSFYLCKIGTFIVPN